MVHHDISSSRNWLPIKDAALESKTEEGDFADESPTSEIENRTFLDGFWPEFWVLDRKGGTGTGTKESPNLGCFG
jgi:hypothetical protein